MCREQLTFTCLYNAQWHEVHALFFTCQLVVQTYSSSRFADVVKTPTPVDSHKLPTQLKQPHYVVDVYQHPQLHNLVNTSTHHTQIHPPPITPKSHTQRKTTAKGLPHNVNDF